eukprot:CAMPEP_0201479960 /NCGR_PEP_ID=MMETSP0151_2-20130828/4574_1 /ASSEMBLY_ACC=CAM_ASM_000257 /TAXON_ID=200890 /ORGANISM="Paramoeba atlantica, Strain 621/1 / CCAP 1560/9" /LENGTH=759 /DNA_ID=CAMNT_0047861689 /DNA_START=138 /DNA_END=2417 /DNA_ORIENTATION=+
MAGVKDLFGHYETVKFPERRKSRSYEKELAEESLREEKKGKRKEERLRGFEHRTNSTPTRHENVRFLSSRSFAIKIKRDDEDEKSLKEESEKKKKERRKERKKKDLEMVDSENEGSQKILSPLKRSGNVPSPTFLSLFASKTPLTSSQDEKLQQQHTQQLQQQLGEDPVRHRASSLSISDKARRLKIEKLKGEKGEKCEKGEKGEKGEKSERGDKTEKEEGGGGGGDGETKLTFIRRFTSGFQSARWVKEENRLKGFRSIAGDTFHKKENEDREFSTKGSGKGKRERKEKKDIQGEERKRKKSKSNFVTRSFSSSKDESPHLSPARTPPGPALKLFKTLQRQSKDTKDFHESPQSESDSTLHSSPLVQNHAKKMVTGSIRSFHHPSFSSLSHSAESVPLFCFPKSLSTLDSLTDTKKSSESSDYQVLGGKPDSRRFSFSTLTSISFSNLNHRFSESPKRFTPSIGQEPPHENLNSKSSRSASLSTLETDDFFEFKNQGSSPGKRNGGGGQGGGGGIGGEPQIGGPFPSSHSLSTLSSEFEFCSPLRFESATEALKERPSFENYNSPKKDSSLGEREKHVSLNCNSVKEGGGDAMSEFMESVNYRQMGTWDCIEVLMFISSIGLPQYQEIFMSQGVDGEILEFIDDLDLLSLPIENTEHRKLILSQREIAHNYSQKSLTSISRKKKSVSIVDAWIHENAQYIFHADPRSGGSEEEADLKEKRKGSKRPKEKKTPKDRKKKQDSSKLKQKKSVSHFDGKKA